jgi:guanylate kinase
VANIKKHHAALGCLFIFISPPSLFSLGDRLRKRGTENEATIVKRLAKAKSEIEYAAVRSVSSLFFSRSDRWVI